MNQAAVVEAESEIGVPGGVLYSKTWQPKNSPRKPPVILLHDSLGCVGMWRDFPSRLSRNLQRPVIAYDRLGFGRSTPLQKIHSTKFIEEEADLYFPALKKELKLDEFLLFGHSVGGAMALTIASRDPGSCKAVITEAAQAFVEQRTMDGIKKAKELFKHPELFAKLKRWHGERAQWVFDAWADTWLSPEFSTWTLEPILPFVKCPVLALHGDRDEYGSTRFPEIICEKVSGYSEMQIIPDCGHIPHREKEDTVLNLVANFIERHVS